MKIAIVIGHSQTKQGKYSERLATTEFLYNSLVANTVKDVDVYTRPVDRGYTKQMFELSNLLNAKGYDLVVELHFNAYNGRVQGVETLGFTGNAFTTKIGNLFCDKVANHYGVHNRGHKYSERNGRGYWFTALMAAPAIIVEPFFGDAPGAEKFKDVEEYACIINEWLTDIKNNY